MYIHDTNHHACTCNIHYIIITLPQCLLFPSDVAYKFTDLRLASEETQTGEEEDATLEYDYREAEREDTEKEETEEEKEEEATEQGATEQAVTGEC